MAVQKDIWERTMVSKDEGEQFEKVTKSYNVGARKPLTDHHALITNLLPKTW